MKSSLLLPKETHRELAELLRARRAVTVSGLSNETGKSLLLSHVRSHYPLSTLVLTSDTRTETFAHWLSFFGEASHALTAPSSPASLQHFLLFMLGEVPFLILPESLWQEPFPSFEDLAKEKLLLQVGEEYPFTELIEDLLARGYQHSEDRCLCPGEYRRTGDTLEIFPIQSYVPYQIRLSFDVVESICAAPLPSPEVRSPTLPSKPQSLPVFPLRNTRSLPISSQLPEDFLLVLDDQDDVLVPRGPKILRLTAFPETKESHIHLRYLSVLKFYTLTDFLNDLKDKLHQGWKVLIATHRSNELQGIFKEEHIRFLPIDHQDPEGKSEVSLLLLPTGEGEILPHSLQNPDLKVALLTDREIFSLRRMGKQRSIKKLALDFLTSLTPGDYVVHMEHGIGRFEGMTQKVIDATTREYLELTYAEKDKLFVPVDQADKLSKYVYEEGNEPVLTRLGTQEWKRMTAKIQKEVESIARELLALYAKRASAKGFAYSADTSLQQKFEDAFPFEETPGQLQATLDIKEDMEGSHPMDRLICGDVGFGKTEVAMRAAFKAVRDGKQVAFIAPITILADQHYYTLLERMKDFSVSIEMLSRFRTKSEQKEILEELRKGDIDIVVGTHRLLQKDVKFWNLGLLIIDEEQRFGVKQKERLKELRASVDILTLTATPIPRTLNLSLHKLRDITTITTPPPGRLPIITEVRKYSDALIRQAILDELGRGGQVYVLHNRVETIDAFAEKLRSLVPQARFVVGHGQLSSEKLEERIMKFKEGDYDVLVSSTIIENGIDLPRANTLIVNETEHFGLSQLYQLRGRVGRSTVQAYAYFLYHTQKLKDDAKKRLRAVVEACELGSGFQIAMRDLEIRGAGEILGVHQSGTMQTVGVSHYLRMLQQEIARLQAGRKEAPVEIENVEILLPTEAFIPSFYIPDEEERISMYQKLAGSEDEEILEEFEEDLTEEFGKLPKQVANLFSVLRLKLACRKVGVFRVKVEDGDSREVVLFLSPAVTAREIMQLLAKNPAWRVSGSTLRISEAAFQKYAKSENYLLELAEEVLALRKERKLKAKGKRV